MRHSKWGHGKAKEAHEMCADKTMKEVGKRYGVTEQALYQAFRRRGFPSVMGLRYKGMEKLTSGERGYIAGIIDGEGCLCFPRLIIGNTNKELIWWLREKIGAGHIQCNKTPLGKDFYVLILARLQVKKLIPLIYPFLIVKKEKARDFFFGRKK